MNKIYHSRKKKIELKLLVAMLLIFFFSNLSKNKKKSFKFIIGC